MCSDACVAELLSLFNKAENLMKIIEIEYGGNHFTPATNELRYAFGHYLKYQSQNDAVDYTETKSHILRAIYDAKEFIMVTILERIKDFEEEYMSVSICSVVSDWVNISKKLNEIKDAIIFESKKLRDDDCEFTNMYEYLKETQKTIRAAVPELEKMRKQNFFNKFIPIAIGVLCTVSGILIAIFL